KAEIDNLEARNKMVQVAQASSEFEFDNSQLAQARELVNTIDSRVRTDEKMLNAVSHPLDRIPLERAEAETDILDRISNHFGTGTPGTEVEASEEVEAVHVEVTEEVEAVHVGG
ncbi:MAG: hypothetical protein QGH11_13210, partial [Pirellulaceae bacterium]|nr:hypothetical protein [Pirellulaceae bacterium]